MKKSGVPKYRRQKREGGDRAFVLLNGQRIYLGDYDSPESKQNYQRVLAQFNAGQPINAPPPDEMTVVELTALYWQWADGYYRRPDGTPTMLSMVKMALKPVKEVYGDLPLSQFGPKALKACRQIWVDHTLSRRCCNGYTGIIKHMFAWGVSNELVPAMVHHALLQVKGLRKGKSGARETKPVKPVPMAHVTAIKPYVRRQIWALIQLQLHTGARPGELLIMRAVDIDTRSTVWIYIPNRHKTEYLDMQREIYLGPVAQEIVKEYMADRPVDAYLFDPRDAEQERRAACSTHRREDQKPAEPKTTRKLRDHYDTASYRRAVVRACDKDKADVPAWHPHQLRHNAGTFIRREYGVEMARIILGHSNLNTTEIYAEQDREKALQIIEKIG